MRRSRLLASLRKGRATKIAMLGHFIPPFIAYAAHYGYECIWLDLEHRAFDVREVQTLLTFCHLYDIDCLVRPSTRDRAQLYRYLEDGATGLVIPHVSNADEARELVRMVKFPPIGDRGTNGKGLEAHFGLSGTRDQLVNHALNETFLIVQIESPTGLDNVDAIAQVEGVDGIFGGGGDYNVRAQHLPESERITYLQAMRRVAGVCIRHQKAWGTMAGNPQELKQWHDLGAKLLVWGVDIEIMQNALHGAMGELNRLISPTS